MKKMSLLVVLGAMLSLSAQTRPAMCSETAWQQSEWISVKGAPVVDAATRKAGRAADGTSVFWRQLVNAKAVKSAIWTTSGLGVYDLFVNGVRVDGDFLKPGFTHFAKTKYAFTYDVTALMRRGANERNTLGVEVSAGWWSDRVARYGGKVPAFRGVLTLTFDDGTVATVGSKAAEWAGALAGPVTHAGIFDGEEYDARQTNAARSPRADFAPGGCEPNTEFTGDVLPTAGAEVVLREDLAIVRKNCQVKPGETCVLDFGQNCAAVPRLRLHAARGTVLTILPGEMLNDAEAGQRGSDGPKGSVYRANLRNPSNGMRLVYTCSGDGWEEYLPRFTFFGYRYLSITATGAVTFDVTTVPVTSITREMEIGQITTGDASVNRLIANVYWGQLSNYLSVPTDCPQRDERNGWTADTQVFTEAGSFNANTLSFFNKWMRDMRDSVNKNGAFASVAPPGCYGNNHMRLGWGDAGVIVPYQVWKQFGDRAIVDDNWSAMVKYVAHVDKTKFDAATVRRECGKRQYADWLSFEQIDASEREAYWSYLGACYWLYDAQLMAQMAKGTGRDAAPYERMVKTARGYIHKQFCTPEGNLQPRFFHLQTAQLFALKLGVLTGEAKKAACAALKQNFADHGGCLQTGFLGTSIIMDTLTENNMVDVAYSLLLQHNHPSWLYSVDQGATTIWERWNSYTKKDGFGPVGMNSFNHYAYGAVLAWIYKTAAGIAADPTAPGFKRIVMKPMPDRRLGFVKASYKSATGLITSAWRYEGATWIWDFTVPTGATALVTLPGEKTAKAYAPGTYHIER